MQFKNVRRVVPRKQVTFEADEIVQAAAEAKVGSGTGSYANAHARARWPHERANASRMRKG